MYKVTVINDGKETVIHHPYFNDVKLQTGKITESINIPDKFTFSILPNNPGYNLIRPLTTLITVDNIKTGKREFNGRILMPTESMSDSGAFQKSFMCESELGYLNDSSQRHGEYHNISVREFLQVMIDNHNRDVADDPIDKTFQVGRVDVDSSTSELYRYLGYENTFESIKDKLISRIGGELWVTKNEAMRYIEYLKPGTVVKPTEIRLSKNLKSITKEVDPTEIITRLIPLGERIESDDPEATDASEARLTIESVNGGLDYIVDHEAERAIGTIVVKSETWDDITQPNILKTRGEQFLKENNRVKAQYQITALDLSLIDLDTESFDVGYYYPVINPVMDINENLRVIGKTTDIINPNQNSLTFGDKFKTASEYQSEANRTSRNVIALESRVDSQIRTIGTLRNEVKRVDTSVGEIQRIINEGNIDELEQAVGNLQNAIDDLNEAMDDIPRYGPATPIEDGLMPASDKGKLDLITVLNSINLDELKLKLDLISVVNPVDLDRLVEDVQALKGGG